jgi:hypothetical protein
MNRTIEDLAASFATLEGVEALVLAGSMTSGLADEGSDYDLQCWRFTCCRSVLSTSTP